MNVDALIGLVLALAALAYLTYAMLRPERFFCGGERLFVGGLRLGIFADAAV